MSAIGPLTRLRVALRANLLQATWNFERQQGVGWAFAFAPVLRALYADPLRRAERLAEHTAYFNTQPTLASIALGAAARVEEDLAAGGPADAESIARLKSALGSTLAALGDRLFWFTLRPFAAAVAVAVALAHPAGGWGALALGLLYTVPHLAIRTAGVGWGYAQGPAVLAGRLRRRIEGVATLIAWLGCVLLGAIVAWTLAPGGEPRPIAVECSLAGGLALGLISAQRPRPSPTQWALGLGVLGLIAVRLRQG